MNDLRKFKGIFRKDVAYDEKLAKKLKKKSYFNIAV